MEDQEKGPKIFLGGLWLNTSKDGKITYLSGKLGFAKLLIFRNTEKKNEKGPDYSMYLVESPKEDQAPPANNNPF